MDTFYLQPTSVSLTSYAIDRLRPAFPEAGGRPLLGSRDHSLTRCRAGDRRTRKRQAQRGITYHCFPTMSPTGSDGRPQKGSAASFAPAQSLRSSSSSAFAQWPCLPSQSAAPSARQSLPSSDPPPRQPHPRLCETPNCPTACRSWAVRLSGTTVT